MITTHAQAVNSVDDEAVLFSFDDCSWPFVTGGRILAHGAIVGRRADGNPQGLRARGVHPAGGRCPGGPVSGRGGDSLPVNERCAAAHVDAFMPRSWRTEVSLLGRPRCRALSQ